MLFYLAFLVAFSSSLVPCLLANDQHNVTIPVTAPQIEYTPFLCSNDNRTEPCEDAWQVIDLPGTTLVSTHGPAPGGIIPQMFFQFKASAFYLSTSAFSNATANLTLSNSGMVVANPFNSSRGMVSVVQLPEAEISTVVLTFIPDQLPARLDISSINLTVTGNPPSSVFLPSMTLPPSPTLPVFSSAAPSSSLPTPNGHRTLVAEAVGITIGLSLGLTGVAVLVYLWRRKRRRRPRENSENETTARSSRSLPPRKSQATTTVLEVGRTSRVSKPKDQKKNGREKTWFP